MFEGLGIRGFTIVTRAKWGGGCNRDSRIQNTQRHAARGPGLRVAHRALVRPLHGDPRRGVLYARALTTDALAAGGSRRRRRRRRRGAARRRRARCRFAAATCGGSGSFFCFLRKSTLHESSVHSGRAAAAPPAAARWRAAMTKARRSRKSTSGASAIRGPPQHRLDRLPVARPALAPRRRARDGAGGALRVVEDERAAHPPARAVAGGRVAQAHVQRLPDRAPAKGADAVDDRRDDRMEDTLDQPGGVVRRLRRVEDHHAGQREAEVARKARGVCRRPRRHDDDAAVGGFEEVQHRVVGGQLHLARDSRKVADEEEEFSCQQCP